MTPSELSLLPPESFRPLKRREYDVLVDSGAFEGERCELLCGRIVLKSRQSGSHASMIRVLTMWLGRALVERATVSVQSPIAATDDSEPEPDIAIVDGVDHLDEHPTSAHLIVEVAHSSRLTDLRIKTRIYAAMGVRDYWVVDLERRELVVHRDPDDDGYRSVTTHGPDERVALLEFPDIDTLVRELLPPLS